MAKLFEKVCGESCNYLNLRVRKLISQGHDKTFFGTNSAEVFNLIYFIPTVVL